MTAGTAQGHATASTVTEEAPASVTAYEALWPSAAATGIMSWTNASNVVTESIDTNATLSAGALSLGASGTAGSVVLGNATSGTVTLQPVTGTLGTVTASLPANTGTIAELNLAQTFSATQTFGTITPTTISGNVNFSGTPTGLTAAEVGLGNVTNNAQTQSAIVPNTAPAAGGLLVGNAGGTAYAPVSLSGDCTLASTGAITCLKTNGNTFTTTYAQLAAANTLSAANTFSAAGAASTPSVSLTGAPYTGGSATTNFPLLYLNDGAAVTTFATGGTEFGINAPSGFSGNFIDIRLNGSTSPAMQLSSTGGLIIGAASSVAGSLSVQALKNQNNNHIWISDVAPSIASGFGGTPSIVANNGTAAFTVNVGTGGSASSGVITMPTATTGWSCTVFPNGAPQAAAVTYSAPTSTTSITLTNYTQSTGVALAWPVSTVLNVNCVGY
jgi:hypothetical protein